MIKVVVRIATHKSEGINYRKIWKFGKLFG